MTQQGTKKARELSEEEELLEFREIFNLVDRVSIEQGEVYDKNK